jgi:hypothetical protein
MTSEQKLEEIKKLMIGYLTPETAYEYSSEVAMAVLSIIDDLPEAKTEDEDYAQYRFLTKKYGKFGKCLADKFYGPAFD